MPSLVLSLPAFWDEGQWLTLWSGRVQLYSRALTYTSHLGQCALTEDSKPLWNLLTRTCNLSSKAAVGRINLTLIWTRFSWWLEGNGHCIMWPTFSLTQCWHGWIKATLLDFQKKTQPEEMENKTQPSERTELKQSSNICLNLSK